MNVDVHHQSSNSLTSHTIDDQPRLEPTYLRPSEANPARSDHPEAPVVCFLIESGKENTHDDDNTDKAPAPTTYGDENDEQIAPYAIRPFIDTERFPGANHKHIGTLPRADYISTVSRYEQQE